MTDRNIETFQQNHFIATNPNEYFKRRTIQSQGLNSKFRVKIRPSNWVPKNTLIQAPPTIPSQGGTAGINDPNLDVTPLPVNPAPYKDIADFKPVGVYKGLSFLPGEIDIINIDFDAS